MLKDTVFLAGSYLMFMLGRQNDSAAYQAMRRVFCLTDGRSNDILAALHRLTHPPYPITSASGIIDKLDAADIERIANTLRKDGYYVFPQRVPEEICRGLIDFASTTPCQVMAEDGSQGELQRFDPRCPLGVTYKAPQQQLVENRFVQTVIADSGLLAIAQAYFQAKAVQDLVAMWWSAPSGEASSSAAQLFHFDMDRIKFLKFFIYLTDVDENNGPHCYVAGSHRHIPGRLRRDGRRSDEEVLSCCSSDRLVEIKGPVGTLCAVDTRGLHKGKRLVSGHRLMFQLEFAINLFGYEYPPVFVHQDFSPEFHQARRQYPYTFASANYRASRS
jgi:hypothetical protein